MNPIYAKIIIIVKQYIIIIIILLHKLYYIFIYYFYFLFHYIYFFKVTNNNIIYYRYFFFVIYLYILSKILSSVGIFSSVLIHYTWCCIMLMLLVLLADDDDRCCCWCGAPSSTFISILYFVSFACPRLWLSFPFFFAFRFLARLDLEEQTWWKDGSVTENSGEACVSSMNDECTLLQTNTHLHVHAQTRRCVRHSSEGIYERVCLCWGICCVWCSLWSFAWTLQCSLYWEMEGLTWAVTLRCLSNVSSVTVYCSLCLYLFIYFFPFIVSLVIYVQWAPKVWDHTENLAFNI